MRHYHNATINSQVLFPKLPFSKRAGGTTKGFNMTMLFAVYPPSFHAIFKILFSIHVSINFKSTSSVTCFTVHIPYHNDLFEISILINPCNHTGHKMFANKQYSHVLDIKFTSYQHCTRHRQTSIAIKLSRITTSWCRCQKIATLWPKDGFYFDIFKYQTSRSLFFSIYS